MSLTQMQRHVLQEIAYAHVDAASKTANAAIRGEASGSAAELHTTVALAAARVLEVDATQ